MIGMKAESLTPPQPVQTFQVSTIRNELVSMQKTIDKLKQEFEISISDVPPQLSQKLEIIRQKQKSIASLVDKERFKTYQAKFLDLQTKIDDLHKRVTNYVEVTNKKASDDRFNQAFLKLKESVSNESNRIRQEIYQNAMTRIDNSRPKPKSNKSEQKFQFHSSLSLIPTEDEKTDLSPVYKDEIDNTPLFNRLKKTEERIKKAEADFNVYQKRREWNMKKEMQQVDDEMAERIDDTHQKLLQYKTQYLNLKTDLSNRSKKKVVDIIQEKTFEDKSQVVTNGDFLDWCRKINSTVETVRSDVEEFKTKTNSSLDGVQKKIENLTNEITNVYNRVIEIDKTMNDFNEQLGYQLDDKIQEMSEVKTVDVEQIKNVFKEFKEHFQNARKEMKQHIDETKKQLDEAEDKIQRDYPF